MCDDGEVKIGYYVLGNSLFTNDFGREECAILGSAQLFLFSGFRHSSLSGASLLRGVVVQRGKAARKAGR